jgi:hypothetical protein
MNYRRLAKRPYTAPRPWPHSSPESVWGSVRPMVTHSGKPYVQLGMVRADVVERMAGAMITNERRAEGT